MNIENSHYRGRYTENKKTGKIEERRKKKENIEIAMTEKPNFLLNPKKRKRTSRG